ncbi:MAG: hypothetical protein SGJ20_00185 [Planctomycetota bacterium]|nr:hypothetical protein [Planctomycetota bacterium]
MPNPKSDGRLDTILPPCCYCQHKTNVGTQFSMRGWTCPAYPDEIPADILHRQRKHETVLPDQRGSDVYLSEVMDFDDGPHEISFMGKWKKKRKA